MKLRKELKLCQSKRIFICVGNYIERKGYDLIIKAANELKEEVVKREYGKKKILIVDDNKLNIKVAKKAIENFGFIIDEATDGIECLEKVKNNPRYDLILMDIMMPNMSGETCLKKLKEDETFDTPVVALTADAIAGSKEKYISEGFKDYIQKPFSRDQIKEKLSKIFKK